MNNAACIRIKKTGLNIAKAVFVTVLCLISVFPIFWTFLTSIKKSVDQFAMPPVWIFNPTNQNYINVFIKQPFLKFFMDSFITSAFATAIIIICGSLAAYSISRYKTKGQHMAKLVLILRILPPVAIILPIFILFKTYGLLDSYIGLILLYSAFNLPFGIWLMIGFFQDLPIELEEAGMVDGCSRFTAMWKIIFPLSRPGLAATSILCLIQCWNEYLFALILCSFNVKTLPVGVAQFVQEHQILWGELTAAAICIMLPIFIFGMFIQKHLVRGLTVGAIK
jgi:multiple sugar transport system permease protein